ncbi:MAG: hypothetical protein JWP63_1524 [Candidatus Solibacter sp.]|nr:hypothetical protein [Candidatus Solibacter sp.]
MIDATGASGLYDINLEWAPDDREANSIIGMKLAMERERVAAKEAADAPAGGSLSDALRGSLGLRLVPTKSQIEILVIDRASKVPVEN